MSGGNIDYNNVITEIINFVIDDKNDSQLKSYCHNGKAVIGLDYFYDFVVLFKNKIQHAGGRFFSAL